MTEPLFLRKEMHEHNGLEGRFPGPPTAWMFHANSSKESGIYFGCTWNCLRKPKTLDFIDFFRVASKLAVQHKIIFILEKYDATATIISACTGRTKHILDRREKRICNCCYDQVLRWNRRAYIADQPWYTLNLFLRWITLCPRSEMERGHNFYFITREAFSQSIFKVVSGSISPPMISRASSVSILDWMKRLSGLAP